jgi:hypothetical protein
MSMEKFGVCERINVHRTRMCKKLLQFYDCIKIKYKLRESFEMFFFNSNLALPEFTVKIWILMF